MRSCGNVETREDTVSASVDNRTGAPSFDACLVDKDQTTGTKLVNSWL